MKEFSVYDQTVDVVSAWQSLLNYAYADELTFFDRYPQLPVDAQDDPLTPDFTALFSPKYGIIGEVKRTLPNDQVAFEKELRQLIQYSNDMSFKASDDGARVVPEKHDIMLILFSQTSSFEIANRIQQTMTAKSKEFNFKSNLVLMEGFNQTADIVPKYVFRKIPPPLNNVFRDECLPEEKRFEVILGQQYKSFSVTPKQFLDYKVRGVFCNDQPPPLYMAVFLWTKLLFEMLDPSEIEMWRRGSLQQIVNLKVNVDDTLNRINEKYLTAECIRRKWISKSLDFLCSANLATRIDHDNFVVKYRNLTSRKEPSPSDEDDGVYIKEYCERLSMELCLAINGQKTPSPPPPSKVTKQLKLQIS